jgi:hypothetical protein
MGQHSYAKGLQTGARASAACERSNGWHIIPGTPLHPLDWQFPS